VDSRGRTIFVADAHRDGKRFIVRADEKLTAFVELESAIYDFAVDCLDKVSRFSQNSALVSESESGGGLFTR
jgi:hypothetical protein